MNNIPKTYLSKREDNTYCIIHQSMPINQYTTKQRCLDFAKEILLPIPDQIWSAEKGEFIIETN